MAACKSGKGTSPDIESAGTLTMNFLASKAVKNKGVLLRPPTRCVLLQQPQLTKALGSQLYEFELRKMAAGGIMGLGVQGKRDFGEWGHSEALSGLRLGY